MGDQWNYNYPPPSTPNYSYPPAVNHPQYNQWPQHQYQAQANQQYTYQPITSYPPPVAYNVPPPAPQQNFTPYSNYLPQYKQHQGADPPNDYVKELENYRYIKSRISEVDGDIESKGPSRSSDSFRKSRSPSPKSCRARRRSRSRSGERRRSRKGDSRSSGYGSRSGRSRSRGRSRDRDRRRSRERSPRHARSRNSSPRPISRGSSSYSGSSTRARSSPLDRGKSEMKSTERDQLLSKWRSNYCSTEEQLTDKLEQLAELSVDEIVEREKIIWTRSTPAELFYERSESNMRVVRASPKLVELCEQFKETLVTRASKVNATKEKYEPPPRKNRARLCKHKTESHSSSESSDDDSLTDEEDCTMEELQRKQQHPDRLHPEMWFNERGEMNDGPLCRCSVKSRKSGIRHGIYPGEMFLEPCDILTNNMERLHHYRITISPPTNFLVKTPTIIHHDEHEFIFEGFSLLSHFPLEKLPSCRVIRFNIEYTILTIEEKIPENFTVLELDLISEFLFKEILELVDLDLRAAGQKDGCPQFHFMPRFVRELPDNGKEILCMKEVLKYLLASSQPLIEEDQLVHMIKMSQYEWQSFADEIKGMVVTYPGKKPCSVRVDQLDRNIELQKEGEYMFPEIVHFGIRPPQLSYAGNPEYQKAWRDYVKFRHLLANMSKPTYEDKRKLEAKENKLQEMRTQGKMKRDVTVAVSANGFYKTGIMCDIIQHAMLIPVLVCHLRFHHSLNVLEESIGYTFQNRALLQLALTHPSYRENFGTNPDHARNSLTNCGIRQPEYGDRRIHYMNTRKRGINTLINIMSRFGKQYETESNITHNERLEFLGDAVVEFLSSIHLFFSFPDLEEGGLATYRAAIVQNQHLSVLARILKLDQFMLYAHGSDLCHDLELRHAMANCFEALMGALFLDGGIEVADDVFSMTFFHDKPELYEVWVNIPAHPLQEQEPLGDRHWIEKFELLKNLVKFEVTTRSSQLIEICAARVTHAIPIASPHEFSRVPTGFQGFPRVLASFWGFLRLLRLMMYDEVETFGRAGDADKASFFQVNCNQIFEKGPALTKEILGKVQAEMVPKRTHLFGYEMKTGQLFLYTGLSMIFLSSCFGATVMWLTDTFDDYVVSQLVISNETDAFRIWQNPAAKALYSFHLFNYTNIEDYKLGNDKKLHVKEVGPYVYSENLEKIDVSFDDDAGTVKYRERRTYTYRPDLSKGSQDDRVFVPNIPLISGSSMLQKENYFSRIGFSGLSLALDEKAFLHIDPDSFILGYEDKLYSLSANYFKWQHIEIPEKIGLLASKVGESSRFITMNTGKKDINRLGLLKKIDEKEELGLYTADSCNSIEGSDGVVNPPGIIRRKQPLHFMLPEFCRRMPMVFEDETRIMNGKVLAYRYTIPEDVFDTPETNPENGCFCDFDDGKCPLKGLFNTQGCSFGSPIYLSNPHFYNADPKLIDDITGLDPTGGDYRSYMNVHPTLGFMMTGRNVMQVNIKVNKAYGVSQMDMFKDEMVLPLAWVETFLDEPNLPQEFVDLINFVSITVPCLQIVTKYASLLTSIFSFIGILLLTMRFKQDQNCCLQRISMVVDDSA